MAKLLRFPLTLSSISVRYKFSGALLLVIAFIIGTVGLVTYEHQKKMLKEALRNRAEVYARQLASVGRESLLTKQELTVYSVLQDFQKSSRVVYAMILDSDGNVFAHTAPELKGTRLTGEVDRLAAYAADLTFQKLMIKKEPVLEASIPIFYTPTNLRIGTARVGLSEEPFWDAVDQQKLVTLWIFLSFIAVGLIVSVALAKVLTKPIYTLAVAMQASANGDLSKQVKVFYQDEIGKLTESFNQMVLSLREKTHMEKYLPFSTIESIKRNRHVNVLKLGGERADVTALFSDVRGFTAMSEKMTPEEIVEVLNIYLNMQSKIIHQHKGAVNKFIGDQVMAIFEGDASQSNAVRAALEIQRNCQMLNWARMRSGKRQMHLGIGINSGDVVMGNIGSEEQMDYTAIGDNINLASRLCSVALSDQIIMTLPVAEAVARHAIYRELEPMQLKGKINPVQIFEVIEAIGSFRRHMRRETKMKVLFRQAGLLVEMSAGTAKNISPSGCLIESPVQIEESTLLDLDIRQPGYAISVPAVVRYSRKEATTYQIGVQFGEMDEKDVCHIAEWVNEADTVAPKIETLFN